ncbi:MAG: hypothetical protein ABEJ92_06395 [Halobacteriales archaeon]
MVRGAYAARVGVVAAAAVVLLVILPFGVADPGAVGVYYGGDLAGPPLAGLFAAVAAIALAAGVRGRTDPPLAAGVAVVLGVLVAGLVIPWAAAVSSSLVGGMTTVAAFEYHRWALAAAGLGLFAGSAWFARAVV